LQRALSRRATFVAALELDPGIGNNLDRLTELERRDIGERVAAANGCRFVPVPPTGFQGVVLSVDTGRRLAILDHRSRQLTIVAAEGTPASLNGRLVEIVRGPGGALVLQQRALSKE
jgi:hypothetical protein